MMKRLRNYFLENIFYVCVINSLICFLFSKLKSEQTTGCNSRKVLNSFVSCVGCKQNKALLSGNIS